MADKNGLQSTPTGGGIISALGGYKYKARRVGKDALAAHRELAEQNREKQTHLAYDALRLAFAMGPYQNQRKGDKMNNTETKAISKETMERAEASYLSWACAALEAHIAADGRTGVVFVREAGNLEIFKENLLGVVAKTPWLKGHGEPVRGALRAVNTKRGVTYRPAEKPGRGAFAATYAVVEFPLAYAFVPGAHAEPAHRHPNGGGWVADTATAETTAYLAPDAVVYDSAMLLGQASVGSLSVVCGQAVVRGQAQIGQRCCVVGHAVVAAKARVLDGSQVSYRALITGQAVVTRSTVDGAAEVFERASVVGSQVAGQVSGRARLDRCVVAAGSFVRGAAVCADATLVETAVLEQAQVYGGHHTAMRFGGGMVVRGADKYLKLNCAALLPFVIVLCGGWAAIGCETRTLEWWLAANGEALELAGAPVYGDHWDRVYTRLRKTLLWWQAIQKVGQAEAAPMPALVDPPAYEADPPIDVGFL
jgi:carbonic anhydrase/acetyltransferase-like protein (isoleucine patch superfamily)